MPFWKKSEDPWDYEPEKPSRPAEPGQEEKDCAPSLMDELRDWNEERKEKKALRETPPPPMICPWCGMVDSTTLIERRKPAYCTEVR